MKIWHAFKTELREVVWLASVIWGLSVLGVGLAVVLAMTLDSWATGPLGQL